MSTCRGCALGFDYGTRRIGVAVGQSLGGCARPLAVLPYRGGGPDWIGIGSLIETWAPESLVVGVPVYLDGTEQQGVARAALRFARQLQGRFRLAVHTVDETLSTYEARCRRAGSGPGAVDAVAAQVILETWLRALPGVAVYEHSLRSP